jgi:hypothetical protein
MFYSSFASASKKYTGFRWRKFSIHFLTAQMADSVDERGALNLISLSSPLLKD